MNQSKITVRYAKSLFILSSEKNMLEKVRNDMEIINGVCRDVTDFKLFLSNPVVKASEKKRIVKEIFKDKVSEVTLVFLELIIRNRREPYLPDIARNFIDLYRKDKGIKTAVLTTSVPLDQSLRNEIIDMIKKLFRTDIELNEQTDSDLIGGFILRVGDQQYDASIASKLKKVRKQLIDRS